MEKQASSRNCFVCGVENRFGLGMKFYNVEPGRVVAEIVVPSQFQGYPGVVHGGIVAAMLDEVSGRTVLQGEIPRWMVTAKLEVRYRRPIPVGQKLSLEGTIKEDKGKVVVVAGSIFDEQRKILAEAEAILMDMPRQDLNSIEIIQPDDWKVYPDEERKSL
jgi:uncharacterized protein (TIGR00369 family)